MSKLLSEKNPFYTYNLINRQEDLVYYSFAGKKLIVSYLVLTGSLSFSLDGNEVNVKKDSVVIISSFDKVVNFNLEQNSKVLEIYSNRTKDLTFYIHDDNGIRTENLITDYKIFNSHKKVQKPWGYEVWYVWLKDYHVLKKIFMKQGNKCSLQYHNKKYETNYLVSGQAKIIKGFHIELDNKKEKIFEKILSTDLEKDFCSIKDSPYIFTNVPGEVHRVYSKTDYVAYEVSTPELDDVVRVQDDNKRPSGLIASEHT